MCVCVCVCAVERRDWDEANLASSLLGNRTTSGMEDLTKVQSGLALFPVAM